MSAAALYIVSTPIGNLGDMVPRALEVLQTVDVIFAEDTRHSKKLMNHFGVNTPMSSFHDHSSAEEAEEIVRRVQKGESVALISDAGTPLVSDPGYQVVKQAHHCGIRVVPVPGACAVIAALSASGLPSDRFYFEGFLPSKPGARRQRLSELKNLSSTVICYESPHRIVATIDDCCTELGEGRMCTLARELTKQFETIKTATLEEIRAFVQADSNQQRGEFVLLWGPQDQQSSKEVDADSEKVLDILLEDLSVKQASGLAAKITGKAKRALYNLALEKVADDS